MAECRIRAKKLGITIMSMKTLKYVMCAAMMGAVMSACCLAMKKQKRSDSEKEAPEAAQ